MSQSIAVSQLLNGQKVVPVVVIDNQQQAIGLAQALIEGGVNVIEVTLRNAFALDAITLIKEHFPDMVTLAGTVNTPSQMHAVINAGVDGIISPGISPRLATLARENNIPYMPGVGTASDVMVAIEHGIHECKLFPASVVGGIDALKAFGGPFSDIRFCPTGGVGPANYQDYLALTNVMCVGGTWLAPTKLVEAHDWAAITELCQAVTQ